MLLKVTKLIELNKQKLKVGISVGDPNGIGIEVILKSFQNPEMLTLFNPVIFANVEIIEYQMRHFNINIELNPILMLKCLIWYSIISTFAKITGLNNVSISGF